MVILKTTIKFTKRGMWNTGIKSKILKPMLNSATILAGITTDAAMNSFRSQRKKDKDGPLIDSFTFTQGKITGILKVSSHVFSGGSKAPYAVYVDKGHKMHNGKWWPKGKSPADGGYNFMIAGLMEAKKNANVVIRKEFGKEFGGR